MTILVDNQNKEEIKKLKLDSAKRKIQKQIDEMGGYSHNIVGLVLSSVADEFGQEEANKLIDEMDITTIFNIHKEE